MSAFTAGRGGRPAGPGAAAGITDGVAAALAVGTADGVAVGMGDGAAAALAAGTAAGVGTAVAVGTRRGWGAAVLAAVAAGGAEDHRYVHHIPCARRRSRGAAGTIGRARAIDGPAPAGGARRGCGPFGCGTPGAIRRNPGRGGSACSRVTVAARHHRGADAAVVSLRPGDARQCGGHRCALHAAGWRGRDDERARQHAFLRRDRPRLRR